MRHGARRLGEMTNGTFTEGTVFPLPAQEFNGVISLIGGGNGMRAIVAGRATNPFVTGRMAV